MTFRSLSNEDKKECLLNLAVEYLTRTDAERIVQSIRSAIREQYRNGHYVLPQQKDFTPQVVSCIYTTGPDSILRQAKRQRR